jgi:hypothetical protein
MPKLGSELPRTPRFVMSWQRSLEAGGWPDMLGMEETRILFQVRNSLRESYVSKVQVEVQGPGESPLSGHRMSGSNVSKARDIESASTYSVIFRPAYP